MKLLLRIFILLFMICSAMFLILAPIQAYKNIHITSPSFEENKLIPQKYTCDGININPSLLLKGIPTLTKSIALIVDDPDAPMGTWVHWVVFNIPIVDEDENDEPAMTMNIGEGTIPGTLGLNDFKKLAYGGPCPPSGTHRYFFKIYALDIELDLREGATKQELAQAMEGHIMAQNQLIGLYSRKE